MEKIETMCRLCGIGCPIEVQLDNNRLVAAVRKPLSISEKGYFCPKIKAAPEIVYSPQRLKTPLMKEEGKKGAVWDEVQWKYVMDHVANELNSIKRKYGAEAVCWMRGQAADWGAPWWYAVRLMNTFGSPNIYANCSICHGARDLHHRLTYGKMTSPDYKHSKCIVVWGRNDRDCFPSAYDSLYSSIQRGAKLIVVDPIKTKLASQADIWLQIKPGCDGLLAMSMIQVIISEDLYDNDFINEWTVGFNALQEAVQSCVPEKVAGKMWLDSEAIKEAARLYAKTKPACLSEGNGIDMYDNMSQNIRSICILRGLTGNIDKKGGDLIPSEPIPYRDIRLMDSYRNDIRSVADDYHFFHKYRNIGGDCALAPVVDTMLEKKPYPIKALIIQGANPAVTMANTERFLSALKELDFIVVIDLFMTQTAKLAHVVLPTTTAFEKTQLNQRSLNRNCVMITHKVIEPVASSWPDWKITFELAKSLGYEEIFPWNTVEEAINYQLEPSGITVDMLQRTPHGIVIEELHYEKYKELGFDTQSGKIEFYSETLKDQGHSPLPNFFEKENPQFITNYENVDFPFIGICGARSNNHVHSQLRNIPSLLKREPEPLLDIHPKNAEERGIACGDNVRIETPNGRIGMKAKISDIVHPGSVRIAYGWGEINPDYSVNKLTDDMKRDPITCATPNRCFMCNVYKEN